MMARHAHCAHSPTVHALKEAAIESDRGGWVHRAAMTYSDIQTTDRVVRDETRRASPAGAYIATVGVLVFLASSFVDWLNTDGEGVTGYQLDSLIPFTGYLGVGLALALLYACKRATRRQHRIRGRRPPSRTGGAAPVCAPTAAH
jgi:hypothetical protein